MINSKSFHINSILGAAILLLLSACGGGGGAGDTNNSGFTNNANTKPQASAEASTITSSTESKASSSASSTESEPSSNTASAIASSQSSKPSASTASSNIASVSNASNSSTPKLNIDTKAPTATATIEVVFTEYDIVAITWAAATDNVGVTAYKIYRNQTQIDQIDANDLVYADFNVSPNSTYVYGVSAGDAVGNWSPIKTILAKTKPQPVPPSSTSSISQSQAASASSTSSTTSNSSKSATSSASSNTSKSATSSTSSHTANKDVTLYWAPPTQREDNSAISEAELGGFLIRHKLKTASDYTLIDIKNGSAKSYVITNLTGDHEFQIAAYDINNLYSSFVNLQPH